MGRDRRTEVQGRDRLKFLPRIEVWAWCEKAQAFGRSVTVKVKFADFQQITRSRTHARIVDTHAGLRDASLALIRSALPAEKGIRLVGVTVSNFDRPLAAHEPLLPLFEAASPSMSGS